MTRLGRSALISLCVIALCGGLGAAAGASKTWLRPRPPPKPELPVKETKAPGMSQPEMEAIFARIAPALPAEVRANLGNALLLEAARAGSARPLAAQAQHLRVDQRSRAGREPR